MKTYTQFQEDMNKFMKDTVMKNKGVQNIRKSLESGKIDINQLKNFAKSDDAKNLRNTAINTLLKVGQNKLDKLKTKASNMQ